MPATTRMTQRQTGGLARGLRAGFGAAAERPACSVPVTVAISQPPPWWPEPSGRAAPLLEPSGRPPLQHRVDDHDNRDDHYHAEAERLAHVFLAGQDVAVQERPDLDGREGQGAG